MRRLISSVKRIASLVLDQRNRRKPLSKEHVGRAVIRDEPIDFDQSSILGNVRVFILALLVVIVIGALMI